MLALACSLAMPLLAIAARRVVLGSEHTHIAGAALTALGARRAGAASMPSCEVACLLEKRLTGLGSSLCN
eukprot:COSAG02_NODE_53133_length_303_cov_1.504902_1_plen_69_part_10